MNAKAAVELERMLDVVIGRVRLCLAAERRFAHGAEDHRKPRWDEMEEVAASLRVAIRERLRAFPHDSESNPKESR